MAKRKPTYPSDHKPGMRVTKGGSSCANCEYLGADGKSCNNEYFIRWNGSKELPAPADEYCSDWWEPSKREGPKQEAIGDVRFEEVGL